MDTHPCSRLEPHSTTRLRRTRAFASSLSTGRDTACRTSNPDRTIRIAQSPHKRGQTGRVRRNRAGLEARPRRGKRVEVKALVTFRSKPTYNMSRPPRVWFSDEHTLLAAENVDVFLKALV